MSPNKTFEKVALPELHEERRRIVWDAKGFIVEGQDVVEDIRRQPKGYSEEVELVNMPPDLSDSLKANRVSFEQVAASRYANNVYEAISKENPDGIDLPSLFVAAAGVKGTIDPPTGWDDVERLIQKVNQHVLNLLGLCSTALGLDAIREFETLPNVPLGVCLTRGLSPGDGTLPLSPFGDSERYMDIIEEQLKPLGGTRAKYIVLDRVMSMMASRMGFGDELVAELDRFIGEVSKPKVTGLVGFFGLE